ncbi:baseplate J/gp47 family protein [Nostoc ellipsosporum NOK]|nr:baseplate J/gp47 family protein [Nostoc ellipsosporum NOK]
MTTNVPLPTFTDAGLSVPPESAILAGLWADFQIAFGGNLNESVATPQGQLVSSLAAMIGAQNDVLLQLVNQIDPAFASGRMQDAIARIYFLSRLGPIPTTVDCDCTGAPGTILPAGSLAIAADGTIYQSLGQATIPAAGTISVSFAALDAGPIACPTGTLNVIYRIVAGWDSVNNPADGVLGRNTETRADFESRRAASVSINSVGILPAVRAAVLNIEDVIDAYVTENPTAAPVTIGGVSIAAHSLYVAVEGGADADVARAIWKKKPPGCNYVGNTTVTVKDTSTGYGVPYPSYDVKFQRPDALRVYFAVEIANNGLVPANAETLIRNAMADVFNGTTSGRRERIGTTIFALRYVAAISALGSWAQVAAITVGEVASPTDTELAVDIDEMPTLDTGDIDITLV